MKTFTKEFDTLQYIVAHSQRVLLVPHTRPDPDAVGSALALKYYLEAQDIHVDIACFSPFPDFLVHVLRETFYHPDDLDLASYDVIIGADSVERGFDRVIANIGKNQVSVAIDHHHDVDLDVDLKIFDAMRAAACEIIYHYFVFAGVKITKPIATALLVGILGDTGSFQHANTTARVLEVAAELMNRGAETAKIIDRSFANKKISTLKLWGKALEKAYVNKKNGMIVTALTADDLDGIDPSSDDVREVASILSTVPDTRFSLIIMQLEQGRIKGSLRAEEEAGVDVSAIAHKLGGGGHHLASGFEIPGNIIETKIGWAVV